jgi:hypothetical protein
MNQTLPPGTHIRNGQLVRRLEVEEDGKVRVVRRPVALSLEDAKKSGADYYDYTLGWIRGGVKMEREHPLVEAGILRDAGLMGDEDDEEDEE